VRSATPRSLLGEEWDLGALWTALKTLYPAPDQEKSAAESLAQTEITQPALFVVNALIYRARLDDGKPAPAITNAAGISNHRNP
jgi:hypothetical protein